MKGAPKLRGLTKEGKRVNQAKDSVQDLIEAMVLGQPVIATNYSANTEFMTDGETGFLVRHRLVTSKTTYVFLKPGEFEWADPDIFDAARAMRTIVARPSVASRVGADARRGGEWSP